MDITMVPKLRRDAGLSLKRAIRLKFRNLRGAALHGFLPEEAGADIYGRVPLGVDPGAPIL
jgi:3-hydroxy-9,10-secoandrosta-1,3,5(10)-triene-9,17-dione monooxygenase